MTTKQNKTKTGWIARDAKKLPLIEISAVGDGSNRTPDFPVSSCIFIELSKGAVRYTLSLSQGVHCPHTLGVVSGLSLLSPWLSFLYVWSYYLVAAYIFCQILASPIAVSNIDWGGLTLRKGTRSFLVGNNAPPVIIVTSCSMFRCPE